jgi:hypothetical protein
MSGINPKDLRHFVIEPICELLASKAGVPHPSFIDDLLIATCAQETHMGVYLHQSGHGPALGIYQMEPPPSPICGATSSPDLPGSSPPSTRAWSLASIPTIKSSGTSALPRPLPG